MTRDARHATSSDSDYAASVGFKSELLKKSVKREREKKKGNACVCVCVEQKAQRASLIEFILG